PGLRGVASAAPSLAAPTAATLNTYITAGNDNTVTVMYGGSELGQGTKTGLAQIAAEELKVLWNAVTVTQADADPAISYVTFGSSATMSQFLPLATAGAAAREMLISAGATAMGVPRDSCVAQAGKVVSTFNGTNKPITY